MVTTPPDAMRRLFAADGLPNFPPRYNVAPTQDVPVVYASDGRGTAARTLGLMRRGLVPSFTKATPDGKPPRGAPLINARAETVATLPVFRDAFRQRRCLVAADGYYEWSQDVSRQGRATRATAPHLFRRKNQGFVYVRRYLGTLEAVRQPRHAAAIVLFHRHHPGQHPDGAAP